MAIMLVKAVIAAVMAIIFASAAMFLTGFLLFLFWRRMVTLMNLIKKRSYENFCVVGSK